MEIRSTTVDEISKIYAKSRKQFRKPYLRYRGKRSLGWVPLRSQALRVAGNSVIFFGKHFRYWNSRIIPTGATVRDGSSFSQDAKGNWYLNLVLDIPETETPAKEGEIGIDLGLKDLAVTSSGEVIENPQFFRSTQDELAKAQRARKKRRARAIQAKIANQRRDYLHKVSTRLVKENRLIVVGGVSSSALKKTKMAKSVSDASWHSLKTMLKYKAITRATEVIEVNETFTTQTCSECGSISGPKGREGLVIREWRCGDCGHVHNRDQNAAINILRLGRQTLVEGAAA
jgi:IS605 OrfB family transposase